MEAERLGVYCSDIIPVIIKGIQEQQQQIEKLDPEALLTREEAEAIKAENAALKEKYTALENQIAQLLNRLNNFEKDLESCCFNQSGESKAIGHHSHSDAPELGLNIPNPFRESTAIQFYLPANAQKASIRISNLEGRQVRDIDIEGRIGHQQVDFHTSGLAAGTYLYSLFVDGELIATRKMMLNR